MTLRTLVLNYGLGNELSIVCQRAAELEPFEVGGVSNALAGNERSSIRRELRRWGVTTTYLDTDTVDLIKSIATLGAQIYCGGEIFTNPPNPLPNANDLRTTAGWGNTNATVTFGVLDPIGGLNASVVTATSANGFAGTSLPVDKAAIRSNYAWVRRRTGVGSVFLWNPDTGAGGAITPLGTWSRFRSVGLLSGGRISGIQLATNGDAVDVYGIILVGDPILCAIKVNRVDAIAGTVLWQMDLTIREV